MSGKFKCIACKGDYEVSQRMYPARNFKGYEEEEGFLCYGCAGDTLETSLQ